MYFKKNEKFTIGENETFVVEDLLGEGGQGEVYLVSNGGQKYALKIYKGEVSRDFRFNLKNNIEKGSPSEDFLWPKRLFERADGKVGYLHFMISDVYNAEHDDEWLKKAYSALKKEYAFWQRERMTATGLNRHYHHPLPKKELIDYYDVVAGERLKLSDRKSDEEKCKLAEGFLAVAESGMDWTPRFGFCGDAILPVDLNANLYALEKHLAEWAEKFEPHESSRFEEAAEKRKRLAEKYFLAADGLYYDYNYVTGERSSLRCSAQFFPFVVGLLRDKAAFLRLADTLSRHYGVLCVEKTEQKTVYQWGYPNSWAPDNFLAYAAAKAVGEEETAERIALCYLETVSAEFEKSGRLWEKYDAVCGGVNLGALGYRKRIRSARNARLDGGRFRVFFQRVAFGIKLSKNVYAGIFRR